ncbi:hypothetical protein V2J09_017204 [Rumex salicifolius]
MAPRPNIPAMFVVAALLVAQLFPLGAAAGSTSKWLTLDGTAPKVVARGGFSGMFPDSSDNAYTFAMGTSLSDVVLWCDVQLTKDAAGICFPDLLLDNSSNINSFYSKKSTYSVNEAPVSGFFSIDYSMEQLANVTLSQGIYSRTPNFDGVLPIITMEHVFQQYQPTGFWVNVQHDQFFSQHKLNMQSFLLGAIKKKTLIDYLSSPEVGFLRGIAPKLKNTKLVFRFLQEGETEPTTNQTYASLKKNLTFIKSFASGILVPKSYIWRFDSSLYLLPHTSLVHDAHAAGLQVFAADFANDNVLSYNYSYNPVSEYLNYIDNGDFSVDGFLSDFPLTPSAAIDCFAHLGRNASGAATPLVISHDGASGDYPGCTDLAYTKAISDGADIIDCSVQMSSDGVPFCLSSVNLQDSTNIAQTTFIKLHENIAALNTEGIFSFRLKWEDIQRLTPAISNPYPNYFLFRNPNYKSAGKLISLADFLGIAQNSTTLSAVVIRIENAAYLAQKEGMSVTDAVSKALNTSGYSNKTPKKVMIQSTNSSVLEVFKGKGYECVYELDEQISDASNSSLAEIKTFSDAVVVRKKSIYPGSNGFVTGQTKVVERLQAFNLSVFVRLFRNEFVSQDWDFFSDINVEMNTFANGAGIDGIITDFPKSAVAYRKNRCLSRGNNKPSYMLPIQPGGLIPILSSIPPAEAPAEVLTDADVSESPLPAVVPVVAPSSTSVASSPKATTSNSHHVASALSFLAMVMIASAMFILC